MAEATSGQPAARPLPPGLDLLWGRRERGKRGPRPGLSADTIVEAAVRLADAEGLEAVSMARVAAELGVHHDVALPLRRQQGRTAPAHVQRQRARRGKRGHRGRRLADAAAVVGGHPAGHARPSSVDHPAADGRSAGRAQLTALRRARAGGHGRNRPGGRATRYGSSGCSPPTRSARPGWRTTRSGPWRRGQAAQAEQASEAADERPGGDGGRGPAAHVRGTAARTRRRADLPAPVPLAWASSPADPLSEREEFLSGIDLILDGVQASIDRAKRGAGQQ